MLRSVVVNDNKNSCYNYLYKLRAFRNGRIFKFKPGINIIIGENGSGKSTLLNIISQFLFCNNTTSSYLPDVLHFPELFKSYDSTDLLDGVAVHHDYKTKAFRLKLSDELSENDIQDFQENFSLSLQTRGNSVGEKTYKSISHLFYEIFKNTKDYGFLIKEIKGMTTIANDFWKKRLNNLLAYYSKNKIKISNSDLEYTILMDEPDRNLDIDKIEELYKTISYRKEKSQLIVVIHNPILIYKLSKLDYVNFIEMKRGYLQKVKDFIKN